MPAGSSAEPLMLDLSSDTECWWEQRGRTLEYQTERLLALFGRLTKDFGLAALGRTTSELDKVTLSSVKDQSFSPSK